ncbi:CPC_1213 family protein [Haloimpatiens massiliensis]|uniref:CPC_1213 family protein n=1 Tax=Haloimpatiens massiliensis TaxID=1658110 RepID=UPI000C84E475
MKIAGQHNIEVKSIMENKMKNTRNNKKEDGKFKKKNIKHGHEESARAVFGMENQIKPIED